MINSMFEKKYRKLVVVFLVIVFAFISPNATTSVYAATTPNLGQAESFGILSSSYVNTVIGTVINGDLGYTTGPAVAPTVNGTTHVANSTYNQAGIDQNSALSALASQPCTFTFAPGAVDLATDTTHGQIGVYTPGVYCTSANSAASIGTGGITLSGSGTFIFRINGALTTVANSSVTLAGGASACDVFWTPTAATTLGANSSFAGTVIDPSGITIGSTVVWSGRALGFGGTVSTTTDTIVAPSCGANANTTSSSNTSSSSNSSSNNNGGNNSNTCPIINSVTPLIIQAKRMSPTSMYLTWGPYSGTDTFIVQYGLTSDNLSYSTKVTGFSTTLNELSPNRPIWVRIAATNGCSVGTYGEVKLIGEPTLPNTGIAPDTNERPWYISVSIFIVSLFF